MESGPPPASLPESAPEEPAAPPADSSGWVFDIQHFSVHDGPGVRSTVFFKGCPLSCRWCSNPESQRREPQILYFRHLCKGCGACVAACGRAALCVRDGALAYDRALCAACGDCVRACLYEARTLSGRRMGLEEVCREVQEDWRIYMTSGGGVTCGGGEALAQPEFLAALLKSLHTGLGYHTCLDTSGFAPWNTLAGLLPDLDLILLDIKHLDSAEHRRMTGVDNAPILDNARRLGGLGFPALVRVPLIPGFNDGREHLAALAEFLIQARLPEVELMPYHAYGRSKYEALGRDYPMGDVAVRPDVALAVEILGGRGLSVAVHQ